MKENNSNEDLTDSERLERLLRGMDFSAQLSAAESVHRAETRAMLMPFLDVFDSLRRLRRVWESREHEAAADDREAMLLIEQQLEDALRCAGVERIPALGLEPAAGRHRILEVRDIPGSAGTIVVEEIAGGFEWHGEVLRKSIVVVSRDNTEVSSKE